MLWLICLLEWIVFNNCINNEFKTTFSDCVTGSTSINCHVLSDSTATETSDITLNNGAIYTVLSYPSGVFNLTLNIPVINVNGECYFKSLSV
jgi:hypothetical protein